MYMFKKSILIGLTILSFLAFSACSQQEETNNGGQGHAELLVTKDFCSEVIHDGKAELGQAKTIFDMLESSTEVEAQSGFVQSINGVASDAQSFWFYYVNGISSDCSARDYILQGGEKVFWDKHSWSEKIQIPAIIGAYPEPFVKGFKQKTEGVTIFYAEGCRNQAEILRRSLAEQGAPNAAMKSLASEQVSEVDQPAVVLGSWRDIGNHSLVKELNKQGTKSGIFAVFEEDSFKLLNAKGEEAESHDRNIAVIAAAGTGFSDASPLWIITSIDDKGVKEAVELLVNEPEKIRGLYGAAVVDGQVVKLPIVE